MPNSNRKLVPLLASAIFLSGVAVASASSGALAYLGARSINQEQETFGYSGTAPTVELVGFMGPARYVGTVTGNAEKDTLAYRPLILASPASASCG
jgi:hypothetical protein